MWEARFSFPTDLLIQSGSRRLYPEIAKRFGRRVTLITGCGSMRKAGVVHEFIELARDNKLKIFLREGVSSNPSASDADTFAKEAKSSHPDVIVGLGGGSTIDMAKAAAFLVTNKGKARDYLNLPGQKSKKIINAPCSFIAIPTTSGSGSEATPFSVLIDDRTKLKKGVSSKFLYPNAVLLDPELTRLMPDELTVLTGFDAFSQALEGFTSKNSTSVSDSFARESLRYIVGNLTEVIRHPGNLDLRKGMCWGAALSGLCIGMVDVNLAHAMSHPLSVHYGLHHGLATALCTIPAMNFNRKYLENKYKFIETLFREIYPEDKISKGKDAIEITARWIESLGIKRGLRNYIDEEPGFERLAKDALDIGAIRTNVIKVRFKDLVALYKKVWKGI